MTNNPLIKQLKQQKQLASNHSENLDVLNMQRSMQRDQLFSQGIEQIVSQIGSVVMNRQDHQKEELTNEHYRLQSELEVKLRRMDLQQVQAEETRKILQVEKEAQTKIEQIRAQVTTKELEVEQNLNELVINSPLEEDRLAKRMELLEQAKQSIADRRKQTDSSSTPSKLKGIHWELDKDWDK